MIRHNIKLAWRRLVKDAATSAMSIVSLSLGVACASIVLLLVQNESNRDQFHEKGSRIYKIVTNNLAGEESWERRIGAFERDAWPSVEEAIPEAELMSRWQYYERPRVVHGDETVRRHASYVDHTFLEMFDFPLLYGSSEALRSPHEVVITRAMAEKMAGDNEVQSLIGQDVGILSKKSGRKDVTISAIVETPPSNSSLQFDMLLHYDQAPAMASDDPYRVIEMVVFLLVSPDADLSVIQGRLDAFGDTFFEKRIQDYRDSGRWTKPESPIELELLALPDISAGDMLGDHISSVPTPILILLSIPGLMVLIAGCANFATITVGRSMTKGREIGIRKVSGAQRWSLIRLSVTESILLSLLAVGLGLLIAQVLIPRFLSFVPLPNFSIGWTLSAENLIYLLGFPVVIGTLAGLYPAHVISKLDTVKALAGEASPGGRNRLMRALIVVQFAASLFLVASTHIILEQTTYQQRIHRGYDPENVMTIRVPSAPHLAELLTARFVQLANQDPDVVSILATNRLPGSSVGRQRLRESDTTVYHYRVVGDFPRTLGVDLIQGRYLLEGGPVQEVVVNEELVAHFGWDDPVGQTFPFEIGEIDQPVVVGVIRNLDFNDGLPRSGPLVLHRDASVPTSWILIRVNSNRQKETYAKLEAIWRTVAPEILHQFDVLDPRGKPLGQFPRMLRSIGSLVSIFAIVISCLGLVGLAMQTLARRTKEVGVRKVLGASVASIFKLLSARFIRLTLMGSTLGCAGSYFAMQLFLRKMSHQLPMTADLFLVPMLGVVLLAVLSIGFHTLRTARTDPTRELRYE
jgi:putative ABC transport system permease protein